ncbi:MAG: hypothetical protein IPO63_08990 [Bacteroidetes bacterium]|nr:hypothetical protein [Bacteroidota bacterium]
MKKNAAWQHIRCVVFILLPSYLHAQSESIPDHVAGANCFLFSQQVSSAAFGNPSMPDTSASFSFGTYSASSFLVKELNEYGIAFTTRILKNSYFGGGYRYKGYALYNTSKATLSFSRFFGKAFSAGIRVERYSIRQGEGYGQLHFWNVRAGTTVRLSSQLYASSYLGVPLKQSDLKSKSPFHIGIMYRFSEVFACIVESEMSGSTPTLRTSLRYKPSRRIEFIGGIGGKPLCSSFGFVLEYGSMKIAIVTAYRPVFGFSPAMGIDFANPSNK